jgi:Flp pilus assembly protein TadD
VIQPQPPASGVVTLHELAHRIPRRAEREYQRAVAADGKGDHKAAITSFQKAIAIDPEFCMALNNLGAEYLQTNEVDLAIEQFNKAVAVDPHAVKPYSNLAIAYLRKEQFGDAERAARRVLDIDRADTHGHLALGISFVMQRKFTPEIQRSLEKAALDFPCANFWLAIGLLNKGNVETARDRLKAYLTRGDGEGAEVARSLLKKLEPDAQGKQ